MLRCPVREDELNKLIQQLKKVLASYSFVIGCSAVAGLLSLSASAAQLSSDARSAIPHEVQQMVVIDYRVMQNSSSAMALRGQVMPPELKQLEEALKKSGLNDNNDLEQLAFVLYRSGSSENLQTVGIAQGQFPVDDVLASFKKQRVKATTVRTNKIYPMGHTGMSVVFLDESTMAFGGLDAIKQVLDVRDGLQPSLLTNGQVMESMRSVDQEPLWSVLDEKGTQTMMKQVLGQAAGSVADFDTVKKHMVASYYTMNFQHGVKFNLSVVTGDNFAAATVSSLLNAAILYQKMSGSDSEKAALDDTTISSNQGRLDVHFSTSDSQFSSLLKSPMFQSMVH
jgi:hypothetical protein